MSNRVAPLRTLGETMPFSRTRRSVRLAAAVTRRRQSTGRKAVVSPWKRSAVARKVCARKSWPPRPKNLFSPGWAVDWPEVRGTRRASAEVMLSPVKLKKVRPKRGLSPLMRLRLKGSYQWPRT